MVPNHFTTLIHSNPILIHSLTLCPSNSTLYIQYSTLLRALDSVQCIYTQRGLGHYVCMLAAGPCSLCSLIRCYTVILDKRSSANFLCASTPGCELSNARGIV